MPTNTYTYHGYFVRNVTGQNNGAGSVSITEVIYFYCSVYTGTFTLGFYILTRRYLYRVFKRTQKFRKLVRFRRDRIVDSQVFNWLSSRKFGFFCEGVSYELFRPSLLLIFGHYCRVGQTKTKNDDLSYVLLKTQKTRILNLTVLVILTFFRDFHSARHFDVRPPIFPAYEPEMGIFTRVSNHVCTMTFVVAL